MERREFLIGSAVLALLAACDGGGDGATGGAAVEDGELRSTISRQAGGGSTELAVSAVNGLGATVYRSLAATQPATNVVLSPASIVIALAMAREGAAGVTAQEMDRVLGVADASALAPSMNALDQALAARSGTRPDASGTRPIEVLLRVVSSLWGQGGLPWAPDFLDRLAGEYGATLRVTDFAGDPAAARDTVNTWVRDETDGRVQEALPADSTGPSTRMVLVNAVYLRAPWLTPFDTGGTVDTPFSRADGSIVPVPMMRSTSQLAYATGNGWQAVDLPYGGYALVMTVVVPDPGRFAEVEAQVSPDLLNAVVGTQALRTVDLGLPRWDAESAFSLNDALAAAGMASAFDQAAADFSAMIESGSGEERLALSAVQHQANISVDEAGTEAAAATAVAVAGSSAPGGGPVTVVADRPYLFFIRDVATGAVVFLGRVMDPSASVG